MDHKLIYSLQNVSSKPLNNLSGAYFAVGEQMDPRFGGNCIAKSLEVVEICHEYSKGGGIDCEMYPLSVQTMIAAKTHRACLITDSQGRQYFFDPSFYMAEPVLISDDLLCDEIEVSCINPCQFPAVFYSDISLFGTTSNFDLSWSVETPYREYEFSYKYNIADLDLVLPTPDIADRTRSAMPNCFLRFLNTEDGFLYCLQYMSFSGRIILKPHFTSKMYYLDENNYLLKKLISQMELSLNLTESEIRRFFLDSHEIVQDANVIWSRKDAIK